MYKLFACKVLKINLIESKNNKLKSLARPHSLICFHLLCVFSWYGKFQKQFISTTYNASVPPKKYASENRADIILLFTKNESRECLFIVKGGS